jgi:hypothetical protein
MNFLSRKVRPAESSVTEDAERIVHREIEITVEREWTSVSAHRQQTASPPAANSTPTSEAPEPLRPDASPPPRLK